MSFDWKGTLGKVAPWIAATMGGPAAGLAVDALCKAAGLAPSLENAQKAAEMAAAGTMTGEQFLKLKEEEQEHEQKMQAHGYQNIEALEEIAYKDRDSARNREIQVKDKTPAIGFYLITAGFFGLLCLLCFRQIPEANKAIIYTMAGSLGTAWIGCTCYYYGTTKNSGVKDQMLYSSTPVPETKTP